ncbi:hypothetical protein RO3G_08971 [Rhizopus delemar RA 99-880]|uniref:Uncharacterized protein n=1 Tax=Rhizopus delemar (strain RA 99-880 / ATCC MYA-4621 / FGSC 9543 / NRRL 43880) TaxID=246409 RepID=I1C731_RHIO9|nr:hypothetical protein RO3G_08971 [Rhizopus delemar RA 99-880]|eukprot:EIE84261.1 hypothetical protein RO3G_08971 [Rhizopus delemar RA 99-880]
MFQLSLTGKPFLLLNPLILALVILSICKSLDEIEMSTLLLIDGLLYINSQDIQDNSGIKLLPAAVVQPNNNKAKKTMRQVIVIGVNSKGAQSLTFATADSTANYSCRNRLAKAARPSLTFYARGCDPLQNVG